MSRRPAHELPKTLCRFVRARLRAFFDGVDPEGFDTALAHLAARLGIRKPAIMWCRPCRIDGGRTWARTYITGDSENPRVTIRCVHPTRWKQESKDPSREKWVDVILHELGHWADEADSETFADAWAHRVLTA